MFNQRVAGRRTTSSVEAVSLKLGISLVTAPAQPHILIRTVVKTESKKQRHPPRLGLRDPLVASFAGRAANCSKN